jgi:hypothetical protein
MGLLKDHAHPAPTSQPAWIKRVNAVGGSGRIVTR